MRNLASSKAHWQRSRIFLSRTCCCNMHIPMEVMAFWVVLVKSKTAGTFPASSRQKMRFEDWNSQNGGAVTVMRWMKLLKINHNLYPWMGSATRCHVDIEQHLLCWSLFEEMHQFWTKAEAEMYGCTFQSLGMPMLDTLAGRSWSESNYLSCQRSWSRENCSILNTSGTSFAFWSQTSFYMGT